MNIPEPDLDHMAAMDCCRILLDEAGLGKGWKWEDSAELLADLNLVVEMASRTHDFDHEKARQELGAEYASYVQN